MLLLAFLIVSNGVALGANTLSKPFDSSEESRVTTKNLFALYSVLHNEKTRNQQSTIMKNDLDACSLFMRPTIQFEIRLWNRLIDTERIIMGVLPVRPIAYITTGFLLDENDFSDSRNMNQDERE